MKYKLRAHQHQSSYRIRKRSITIVVVAILIVLLGARILAPLHRVASNTTKGTSNTQPFMITDQVLTTDGQALGIAAGSSLPSLSPTALSTRLDGIRASGATWVRLDIDWSLVQSDSGHNYNWTVYDRIINAATARHLTLLGILDNTPVWAREKSCSSDSHCPPSDPNQFASFARAASLQLGPEGIRYWEVWNEPNNNAFWQPAANAARYTALLKKTYDALHAADHRAYVITAGLSPASTSDGNMSPYDFLAAVYQNGGKGYFDAVADHPYTFPLSPASNTEDAWTQMAGGTHSLRSLMVTNGDAAKKLWITEFGAPTGGPGPVATLLNPNLAAHPYVVDNSLQAKILSDAILLYRSYQWAGPFFYYTYQDPGIDPSTNENFFGLVTAGGAKKPSYTVFQNATAQFLP